MCSTKGILLLKSQSNKIKPVEQIDAKLYRKKRYNTPDQFIIDLLEKRQITKILSDFAPYKNALDIPCGYGRNGERIRKFCKNLVGCDISENMIKETTEGTYDSILIGDIKNIPFEDNSFDLVLCIRLFHHFEEEEIMKSFNELLRVSSSFVLFSFYRPVMVHRFFRKLRNLPPRIKMIEEKRILSYLHKRAEILYSAPLIPILHSQHFVFIKKF